MRPTLGKGVDGEVMSGGGEGMSGGEKGVSGGGIGVSGIGDGVNGGREGMSGGAEKMSGIGQEIEGRQQQQPGIVAEDHARLDGASALTEQESRRVAVNQSAVNHSAVTVNRAAVNQTDAGGARGSNGDWTRAADSRFLWALQRAGLSAVFFFSWVHSVSFLVVRAGAHLFC
jgi:hypothetical protein